jgi:hypothetical protein
VSDAIGVKTARVERVGSCQACDESHRTAEWVWVIKVAASSERVGVELRLCDTHMGELELVVGRLRESGAGTRWTDE